MHIFSFYLLHFDFFLNLVFNLPLLELRFTDIAILWEILTGRLFAADIEEIFELVFLQNRQIQIVVQVYLLIQLSLHFKFNYRTFFSCG